MKFSRRRFLCQFSLDSVRRRLREAHDAFGEQGDALPGLGFFDSYENCYPLVNEYSYFIDDEIKALGIDVKGKSRMEIVQEIYELKGRVEPE